MGHVTGKTTLTPSMLLCVILTALPLSADVQIVNQGRPTAVILVGDNAGPVAYEAAEEIARVIEKASGARLRIYPENEFVAKDKGYPRNSATQILVGRTEAGKKLGVDVTELPPEGFLIRTVGKHLIIAGNDSVHSDWGWRAHREPKHLRGTWYAACAFLEHYLGVRWLWPGSLGEVIPENKDISIGTIDRTEAPKLVTRVMRLGPFYGADYHNSASRLGLSLNQQFGMAEEAIAWMDHHRLGSSISVHGTEFGSGYTEGWLDPAEHPEWFAMQGNGKRLLKASYSWGGRVRLCLSNPGLIDEVVKRIVAYLDAHPNINGYGFAPSDLYGSHCVCEECKKWGPGVSDTYARHVKAVADKVAQVRPGKYVYAFAYDKYAPAPTSDVVLPDNVMWQYVGTGTDTPAYGYFHEEKRQESIRDWDGWAKITKQMAWRPNQLAFYAGAPRVYVNRLGEDFRHYYQNKMVGIEFDSLLPNWAVDSLNAYVTAGLAWDPELDVREIVDDYCRQGFNAAAPAVKEYFNELERITDRIAAEGIKWKDGHETPGHYTLENLRKLRDILKRASTLAANDEQVLARIDFLAQGLDLADIEVPIGIAVLQAKRRRPSPEDIERYRKLLDKRATFLKEHRSSMAFNAVRLSDFHKKLEEELFVTIKPGAFDDLPNAYNEILTLPEKWKFKTDPAIVGEKERWFAGEYDDSTWKDIRVGEFWEEQGYENYDGTAWYRLNVVLPKELAGQTVQLCFGAADETAKAYIYGQLAGEHDIGGEGWDKRFFIDITKHVKPGKQDLIAVRVIDTLMAGGLWRPIKVVVPKETLHPVADVWLRRSFDIAYGKGLSLAIGAKDYFRSAIVWQLPENIKISKARVVLPLRYHKGTGSYAVYPLREAFYEIKATWKAPFGAEPWKDGRGAGAAMKGEPVARVKHGPYEGDPKGTPETFEFDITELAREWASGQDNFGILIVQDPLDENASASPYSREVEDAALRPRLELKLISAKVK